MLIVASTNGGQAIVAAMEAMRRGGSAVDAVEVGVRIVESDPDDHSVGFGGGPNMVGQVEVDASIMDGTSLAAGAVAALQGYENPVSVARKVMEQLPHVLLVGEGAARFAAEMGFPRRDLLTDDSRRDWAKGLARLGVAPDTVAQVPNLAEYVRRAMDPKRSKDTTNFLARDAQGKIAAAASTSGWMWKYPGRISDSPVIGAGNYADTRYGAAACTGRGEMAIRLCTARSVVLYMKMGMPLREACLEAMREVRALPDRYYSGLHILALDARGEHFGVSNGPGRRYVYMTDDMAEPAYADQVEGQ